MKRRCKTHIVLEASLWLKTHKRTSTPIHSLGMLSETLANLPNIFGFVKDIQLLQPGPLLVTCAWDNRNQSNGHTSGDSFGSNELDCPSDFLESPL